MFDGVIILRLALSIVLYAFLSLTFYVMWQSLRQNAQRDIPQPPAARLVIEQENEEEQSVALLPVSTIGRADDNTLQLDDEFSSANHAMIMWRDNVWWIEDMGSHNGTYVNQIQINQPTPITFGDHIRIGQTMLRFEKDGNRKILKNEVK